MMNELKENFTKGWLNDDPGDIAATLLGIFTFVFLCIMLRKSEKRKKILKQQAIENNTAIEARIVSRHRNYDSESDASDFGVYRYTLNGKIKEYTINSIQLPDTIKLYPKNSAGTKVFSDYDRTVHAGIAFNVLAAIAVHVLTLWITRCIF